MKVFTIERQDYYSYGDDYKAVVVAKDELYAERFARLKLNDFRKAKLKVTEVNLEDGEQILSVENVGG